jgi:predicted transcriptional regulator
MLTLFKSFLLVFLHTQLLSRFQKQQFLRSNKTLIISTNIELYPSMKRTPCEYILWNGLPVIRKEIAESMITDFGLNQKEAAEKLGMTPAAVCQYLSKKRGNTSVDSEELLKEISLTAERIIQNTEADVVEETCRICKLFMEKGVFPGVCSACSTDK